MAERPAPEVDGETALIQRYFAPLAAGYPGALELADDCALVSPAPGCELVITTDPIIEGVHFADVAPGAVAWKALAVNVSDLVAKGAMPLAYLMALALPYMPGEAWMHAFASGLGEAQAAFGCHLIGGDTDRTPGPLTVSITAIGEVPTGKMLKRSGAKPGDLLFVAGTIGDAHLGLRLAREPGLVATARFGAGDVAALKGRQQRPVPRVALVPALREYASAALDVSDGLVRDAAKLAAAAQLGLSLEIDSVPLSQPARAAVAAGFVSLADLVTGGEDYEVLCAVPMAAAAAFGARAADSGVAVTRIGIFGKSGEAFATVDARGRRVDFARTGWVHF